MTERIKRHRGLASMTPERRREIASMGGKATPTQFKKGEQRSKDLGRRGGLKAGVKNAL